MRDPSTRSPDPALDVLRYERQSLDPIFAPRNIAVIGTSERPGSVGRTILASLIDSPFGEVVFPVNPEYGSVLELRSYPNIASLARQIDLAVIATPAATVPGIVAECADVGVKGAVIISAGLDERGRDGQGLEQEVLAAARRGQMRLIGPNSLGIMRPHIGLNATFAGPLARPGNVAFISQSGALGTAILDWSAREKVGFSAFVSVGSMLDVDWGDLIDYLGDDPQTQSILIYMESIGDARAFLSAAREVALNKPIIAIKAGWTAGGSRPVAPHSGRLAGSGDALDAVFQRCGVLRVASVAELFYMAEALAKQPRPQGPRLVVVTNAGGPGVLAADALVAAGGELAVLSPETTEALDAFLRPEWSHDNPIDILGDATPERYRQAIDLALREPAGDGALVILTPQAMTEPERTAEELRSLGTSARKPILASWMGGARVAAGEAILNEAGIPTFAYPDTAARMFHAMWRYSDNLRALYETPALPDDGPGSGPNRQAVEVVMAGARQAGRTSLDEHEWRQILAAYGIPVVDLLGGAVQPASAGDGYELIVGSSVDPRLGPILVFGTGGRLMEIAADRALALPPLNSTLARRMMEQTRISKALAEMYGGDGGGLAAIERLLVRFSQLVVEQRRIKEIEVNPLLVMPDRMLALHARMILFDKATPEEALPRLAIRPYPTQYVTTATTKDGTSIVIRPIRPEDEPLMVQFHATLSERSVYLRYFHMIDLSQRVMHERLTRICFIDYDREMALVAERTDEGGGERRILAVGRLSKLRWKNEAEFALLIGDPYQGQGLGTELLRRLVAIGRDEQISRITADILPANRGMRRIAEKLGFRLHYVMDEDVVKASLDL